MRIYCQHCGLALEVLDDVANGQHILCPCCNKKFSYFKEERATSGVSSVGGKGRKLWLPICLIAITVVLVIVKLHFFPSDHAKLKELTTWYESQLDYNGLFESGFGVENEDDIIGCGAMFILGLRNDRDDMCIRWFPKMGQFIHPRSMTKGFAKDLMMTRITIEELRTKLHQVKKPHRKATVIPLPEGLTEEDAKEYLRKVDGKSDW